MELKLKSGFTFDYGNLVGDGKVTNFPSSYSDYMEYKVLKEDEEKAAAAQSRTRQQSQQPTANSQQPARSAKLSFKEKREMEQIEQELQQLEQEKAQLEDELNSGTLPYDQLQTKSARIGQIIARTDQITMRWLELSEKS